MGDEVTRGTVPEPVAQEEPQVDEGGRPRLEQAADVLRKVFATGMGAIFATEKGLRKVAGELPKEAASYLVSQAQHTKDEVVRVVAGELRHFLDNLDLDDAFRRVLTQVAIEVKAEIRFRPTQPLTAEVTRAVSVKKSEGEQEKG